MVSKIKKIEDFHIFVYTIYIVRLLMWIPIAGLIKFFLRMKVEGTENLNGLPTGRVIFAGDHYGEIDPQAFQFAFKFPSKFLPIYFVSLPKYFYTFKEYNVRSFCYGGLFFRLMGAYPVYKGLNNYEKAFTHHIKILEKNYPILIFPESRRRKGKEAQVKPGIIYLAKRTNAVVVPVKFKNTNNITFKDVLLRRRKIKIIFGRPIESSKFTSKENKINVDEMKYWATEVMKKVDALS